MEYTEKRIRKLVDDFDKYNYIDTPAAARRQDKCEQTLKTRGVKEKLFQNLEDAICLSYDDARKGTAVEQAKRAIVKDLVAKRTILR